MKSFTNTKIWLFNKVSHGERATRLELVARMALSHDHYVLLVTYRNRFEFWHSSLPSAPKLTMTDVASHFMRRSTLPEKTVVLVDSILNRGHLAMVRTKSMQECVPIISMV